LRLQHKKNGGTDGERVTLKKGHAKANRCRYGRMKIMDIVIRENLSEECYELIDADSDQSHDADGAKELIAKVFEKRWAIIIQHAIKNRLVSVNNL
jgi:hypothetical protein